MGRQVRGKVIRWIQDNPLRKEHTEMNTHKIETRKTNNGYIAFIDDKPITQFENPLEPYYFDSERNAEQAAKQLAINNTKFHETH